MWEPDRAASPSTVQTVKQSHAGPLLWVVAGEASGDARAEELLGALQKRIPDLRMGGAGGPKLQSLATASFDNWLARASVLGLWDVLRQYGYFRSKFHAMLSSIHQCRPDGVLLVDYPGFNLRLARALRKQGYQGKLLYFISPQVWAWNRGRIDQMAAFLDLMICVFPFEKPMYEASGLRTVFAGHPLLEALRNEYADTPPPRHPGLVALLPGSRRRELDRNLPVMLEAARLIVRRRPGTQFAIAPARPEHLAATHGILEDFDHLPVVVEVGGARHLMRTASAGIVCSGTATLEAAWFGLPYCLIYRTAWLTFEVGKRLLDVKCLGIMNYLNNYQVNPPAHPKDPAAPAPHVVREFIQHLARPREMAEEVIRLLDDAEARQSLLADFQRLLEPLDVEEASDRAAEAIAEALGL